MSFDAATDYRISVLEIDGKDIRPLFYSIDIYQHVLASAITGTMVLVETSGNQFLNDNKIEGNERVEIEIETYGDEGTLYFSGYVNKIHNRIDSPNGTSTYAVDFTSPMVRENENKRITRRYKNQTPQDVVKDVIDTLNRDAEIELKSDVIEGNGFPMHFLGSNWRPTRVIQYVQHHGVPSLRGGMTSIAKNKEQDATASGTGSFMFFETLNGFRFGSSVELLAGKLSKREKVKAHQSLATGGGNKDDERNRILNFDLQRNNDTQTQQRSGAVNSKCIAFDMDTGLYNEQIWVSEFATEKQKASSHNYTRLFSTTISNEKWSNECVGSAANEFDTRLKTLQQGEGTASNVMEGIGLFTMPVRIDIAPGDEFEASIYQASNESAAKLDEKYSGNWIINSVAHSFSIAHMAAYTKVSCLRATNQTDDVTADKKVSMVPESK